MGAFFERDQPVQGGEAGEDSLGNRTAGDGEAGLRIVLPQPLQNAAGDHRVANARRGDEQMNLMAVPKPAVILPAAS